jgi:hypothetical protein
VKLNEVAARTSPLSPLTSAPPRGTLENACKHDKKNRLELKEPLSKDTPHTLPGDKKEESSALRNPLLCIKHNAQMRQVLTKRAQKILGQKILSSYVQSHPRVKQN